MTLTNSLTVENWLNNLAPSTQIVQKNYFKTFMTWVHLNGGKFKDYTPDQLIEYQKQENGFDLLDSLVHPFVRQAVGTFNTKNARYNNIRSFFIHNRAVLPRDKQFKIRPEREPIQGTLSAAEIKLAALGSNEMYQAMFFTMFQGAMDQEMVTYWSLNGWDSLHEQLDQDIIKIELPGRKLMKNVKPFYTFIGSDAIKSLKAWLNLRKRKVEQGKIPKDSKVIFCTQFGTAIAKTNIRRYWLNRLVKVGVLSSRTGENKGKKTGKGLHEMRDVWRSLWSKSPASHVVGEYLMGHQIDKLGYDKAFRDVEFYREEYAKALPYLQLVSSGAAFGRIEKNEVDQLKAEIARLKTEKTDEVQNLKAEIADIMKFINVRKNLEGLVEDMKKDNETEPKKEEK